MEQPSLPSNPLSNPLKGHSNLHPLLHRVRPGPAPPGTTGDHRVMVRVGGPSTSSAPQSQSLMAPSQPQLTTREVLSEVDLWGVRGEVWLGVWWKERSEVWNWNMKTRRPHSWRLWFTFAGRSLVSLIVMSTNQNIPKQNMRVTATKGFHQTIIQKLDESWR